MKATLSANACIKNSEAEFPNHHKSPFSKN